MLQAAIALLVVNVALCVVMIALVLVRKARRDRVEARSRDRRRRFTDAVVGGDPAGLLQACREAAEGRCWVDLAVAIDTAGESVRGERLRALQDAAVDAGLVDGLFRASWSRSPIRRALAAQLLARLRACTAINVLERLVRDPDVDVRLTAVAGLGVVADGRAARALVAALHENLVPPERIVERIGAPWALEAVLDELDVLPAGHASRPRLAQALGYVADHRAGPILDELLQSRHVEEQINAARALGKRRAFSSLPALMSATNADAWQVRAQACRALGHIGSDAAVDVLCDHLGDPSWWVRAAAATSLGQLGRSGIDALRDAAASHPDRYARERSREELTLLAIVEDVPCVT